MIERWIVLAAEEAGPVSNKMGGIWNVVDADEKKRARLNCIHHLLSQIRYKDLTPEPVKLPPRQKDTGYKRPPINSQHFVPAIY